MPHKNNGKAICPLQQPFRFKLKGHIRSQLVSAVLGGERGPAAERQSEFLSEIEGHYRGLLASAAFLRDRHMQAQCS